MEKRALRLLFAIAIALSNPSFASAQATDDEELEEDVVETEPGADDEEEPRLRPPSVEPIAIPDEEEASTEEEEVEESGDGRGRSARQPIAATAFP